MLAEKGSQQPRSLSVAFLKPVQGSDQEQEAISAINSQAERFDNAYGACADTRYTLNVLAGEGSFGELLQFLRSE